MKISRLIDHEQSDVHMAGAERVRMRMLIGPDEDAPTFHMRHFEVQPAGHTPDHQHDFEHEVLVLKGQGLVKSEAGDRSIEAGMVVWIPGNEPHQFQNTGPQPLELICLIPAPGDCTNVVSRPRRKSTAKTRRRQERQSGNKIRSAG